MIFAKVIELIHSRANFFNLFTSVSQYNKHTAWFLTFLLFYYENIFIISSNVFLFLQRKPLVCIILSALFTDSLITYTIFTIASVEYSSFFSRIFGLLQRYNSVKVFVLEFILFGERKRCAREREQEIKTKSQSWILYPDLPYYNTVIQYYVALLLRQKRWKSGY